jgi:hypothetical protein
MAESYGHGSFWPKAKAADTFILLDTVQFSPHSYTCRALLPNGHMVYEGLARARNRVPYITVPCKHPQIVPIKDVLIDWSHYRPSRQLKSLELKTKLCNGKFKPWVDALAYAVDSRLIQRNSYDLLVDWNTLLILKLAEDLHVGCQWRRASQTLDYKMIESAVPRDPDYRILSLCNEFQATTYLTGPSWSRYAPNLREVLKEHGIELEEITS